MEVWEWVVMVMVTGAVSLLNLYISSLGIRA